MKAGAILKFSAEGLEHIYGNSLKDKLDAVKQWRFIFLGSLYECSAVVKIGTRYINYYAREFLVEAEEPK